MLRSLNCRYAQGYLISRPMPSYRLGDVYAIGEPDDEVEVEVEQLASEPNPPLEERTPVRYTSSGVITG